MHTGYLNCLVLLALLTSSCKSSGGPVSSGPEPEKGGSKPRTGSIGVVGDTADVKSSTKSGLVLMGGGTDVDEAFQWMIERAGGGDAVIIRVSGTDAYNPYVKKLGSLNSVETLKIDSRSLANNEEVATIIRHAELLFIAGGDQSDYVNYWKGTKTADAINYLLKDKKVPVGGTSAGCAILGSSYFTGARGSVTSEEALNDPTSSLIDIDHDDFLKAPFLNHVITDQHYLTRNRQGRHVVFISKVLTDLQQDARGIASDERTAVCIDEQGVAMVFGESKAYFLQSSIDKKPEIRKAGEKLEWNQNNHAVAVYEINGSPTGAGHFQVTDYMDPAQKGGRWYWWWVKNGELKQILK
ncbi:Cyanophycinase [bacterium A37T11]|nr:Cyanophycinase [bacterium A37T11]